MSSVQIVRLIFLVAFLSTVAMSYSILPSGEQSSGLRFWQPVYGRSDYSNDFDNRDKREMDDIENPFSKRTNLKRLVILSARGFGKK